MTFFRFLVDTALTVWYIIYGSNSGNLRARGFFVTCNERTSMIFYLVKAKKFLSVDEQIHLLKSKGLLIPSVKIATEYLNSIGYYKLVNGYKKPFIIKTDDANFTKHLTYKKTKIPAGM